MAIQPRDEQMAALIENDPGGPVNMLNLLKFKEFAEYEDGSDSTLPGKDAYMRYGAKVAELVTKLGGEFLFFSDTNTLLIGDGDLQWDMVGIVKYPSVAAFIEMTSSSEYQEIHFHRDAGLAHQQLVQC
ncbi:MAG: DUF1330 domain-containing protein [Pseudomonadales bacterium]